MKMFLGMLLAAAMGVMMGCESTGTQAASTKTDQGTSLGSTGVKVSGSVEAGGTVNNR